MKQPFYLSMLPKQPLYLHNTFSTVDFWFVSCEAIGSCAGDMNAYETTTLGASVLRWEALVHRMPDTRSHGALLPCSGQPRPLSCVALARHPHLHSALTWLMLTHAYVAAWWHGHRGRVGCADLARRQYRCLGQRRSRGGETNSWVGLPL
jgi:hypothetical protein